MTPALIGFGGRKGAGKDAAAEALTQTFGYASDSVSYAIDQAARQIDPIVHVTEHGRLVHYVEYLDEICDGDFALAKKNGELRHFLEQIGSLGRSISETIWTDRAEERLLAALTRAPGYALTGVRFPREADMVRRHGGLLVWISRPDHENPNDQAVTENSIGPDSFDVVIVNDGTLADLHQKVLSLTD